MLNVPISLNFHYSWSNVFLLLLLFYSIYIFAWDVWNIQGAEQNEEETF